LCGTTGVLLRGPSGAGKSALAAALIARGATLIADDQVFLSACHGRLVAGVPFALAGRIEVRGLGIVSVPHEPAAVIHLIADLVADDAVERMPPDRGARCRILDIDVPHLTLPRSTDQAAAILGIALADRPIGGDARRAPFSLR
jgi:HPr kinase/phosphorylase